MNKELMFSVIVVTYNQEKYISQTLDSILRQEHNYKYEIVIGEDCSSDGTKKIIEEYAAKYPNIIKPFYNNPNKGLIHNYFDTISHCKGKYIMDCAGDDWWLPGKVKTQIEFMESHPEVGMCYGKAKQFIEHKKRITRRAFGSKKESFDELIIGNSIPALTICMRKTLFEQYCQDVEPTKKTWLMEDYPLWLWFSINSQIHFINNVFAVYRILDKSLSHFDIIDEKTINYYKSVNEIKNYFSELKGDYPIQNCDIHSELSWLKASNSLYKRAEVLEEIRQIVTFSRKDKTLYIICKSAFLFWLLRFRWKLMGIEKQ